MRRSSVALLWLAAAALVAQDWQSMTSLPAVDLGGLTPAQKTTVLNALREGDCSCGCGMKLAECRVKDPSCYYSRGMAATVVDAVKSGKSGAAALAAAKDSKFGKGPQTDKLLEDPVTVRIAGAPSRGPSNAAVTLVEFSDFQCPYCIKAAAELPAVLKAYPTQVRLIFKQFPLDTHSQAALAAAAALAAQKQGKFWELHDALFAQHAKLSRPVILQLAAGLKLDMKRFQTDLDSPETRKAVATDVDDGLKIGVDSTPTLFINGQHYNGVIALGALKPILDGQLKHTTTARR
jgi:protein-disulfide isomerase